jgi:protein-L-isoaspartate(D-aspartate) O-methyltransferase
MKDTFTHKGMRNRLVETLKKKGIIDTKVLQAINTVPRHLFMDSGFVDHAYADKARSNDFAAVYSGPTN